MALVACLDTRFYFAHAPEKIPWTERLPDQAHLSSSRIVSSTVTIAELLSNMRPKIGLETVQLRIRSAENHGVVFVPVSEDIASPRPERSASEPGTCHWLTQSSPPQHWSLFREESAPMIHTSPASREYNPSGAEADQAPREFRLPGRRRPGWTGCVRKPPPGALQSTTQNRVFSFVVVSENNDRECFKLLGVESQGLA